MRVKMLASFEGPAISWPAKSEQEIDDAQAWRLIDAGYAEPLGEPPARPGAPAPEAPVEPAAPAEDPAAESEPSAEPAAEPASDPVAEPAPQPAKRSRRK